MKIVKSQNKQNLLDISVQELGGVSKAFKLALDNDMSITTVLNAGTALKIPDDAVNKTIVNFYRSNAIKPATASNLNIETLLAPKCGIGCMVIGNSFKIG